MALGTFTELKASLAGWLHRSDLNTTATGVGVDNIVADWITLFEAEINRKLRLRVMESDEALTMTVGSRLVALPTGYIEPLGLWLTLSSGQEPLPIDPAPISQLPRSVSSGAPIWWAVDGTNLAFDCPADQAYALTFRMLKSFALSVSSPTNWLLTNFPNLYLYGALRHSPGYLMQDQRRGWEAMYQDALTTLENSEARSGALVTLRSDPAMTGRARFNINSGR